MTTLQHGSCHCGRIRFDVKGEPASGLACNCSMCRRRGSLLWFVSPADFTLTTPEADAATYRFNHHVIAHRLCPVCGIHAFGQGRTPQGQEMVAVNLRCLEDFDLDAVPVQHFDGRAL